MGWLLLLFIILPVVELALLIKVGRFLDIGPTIAIVIVTGFVGAALAKRQGLRTLGRINAALAEGKMPTTQLGEGVLILLAAAVLITPGFLTDLLGIALLIPPIRRLFLRAVTRYFASRLAGGRIHINPKTTSDDFHEQAVRPDGTPADVDNPFGSASGAGPGGGPMKHVKNEAIDD